ncbi:MAG: endonuclease [Spirochaetes bacterium]|nr:endonuclease [Spirochaetota bacterium]
MGTVYLIHFNKKLHHARHYLGYAEDVEKREKRHRSGDGSRLLHACNLQGIKYRIVRKWENVDRNFERKLKNRKEGPKLCPVCNKKLKGKLP